MKAATETSFRLRCETVQSYLFISGHELPRKCDITIMTAAQEAPRIQDCIAPSVLTKEPIFLATMRFLNAQSGCSSLAVASENCRCD